MSSIREELEPNEFAIEGVITIPDLQDRIPVMEHMLSGLPREHQFFARTLAVQVAVSIKRQASQLLDEKDGLIEVMSQTISELKKREIKEI